MLSLSVMAEVGSVGDGEAEPLTLLKKFNQLRVAFGATTMQSENDVQKREEDGPPALDGGGRTKTVALAGTLTTPASNPAMKQ